jgi:hypothetical protein
MPLHAEVYTFSPSMLDPSFLAAFAQLQQGRPQTFLANLVVEECGNAAAGSDSKDASEVYSFPLYASRCNENRIANVCLACLLTSPHAPIALCIYLFIHPRFRKEVCDQIADEIAAFLAHLEARHVPVQRPNSMNKYGLIMRHMGLTAMMV